jgi:branched-chain amino acid transport system permease protein
VNLMRRPEVKRLVTVLMVMAMVTLMTGESGDASTPPTTGPHGAFFEKVSYFGLFRARRWMVFLTLGLLAYGLMFLYQRYSPPVRKRIRTVTATPKRLVQMRSSRFAMYAVVIVIALSIPHLVTQSYWMYLIVEQVGVWILLAEGLNVVVGFAGLLDLGYVAFYAIGAYITAWMTGVLPAPPLFHHAIPTLWVIPIGVLAAMVVGIMLGIPTLRLRGDYLAIVTLGFALIIDDYVGNQNGITGGGEGSLTVPHFSVNLGVWHYHWGLNPVPYYYLCLIFVVLFVVVFSLLEHSRVGRSWVALREDEVAAESIGINPLKYKVMAFAVGAASGGFAGVLSAGLVGNINPTMFQYQASINILILVIFGGMGSIWGVALGAVFVQVITSYMDNYQPWGFQINDLYMYIGALLIIMMIFRPAGLMPSRRRRREIKDFEETGEGHLDEVLTGDEI